MDWVNNVSYDWSMIAFGNHCSIIAHILYLKHPSNGNGGETGRFLSQVTGHRSQLTAHSSQLTAHSSQLTAPAHKSQVTKKYAKT